MFLVIVNLIGISACNMSLKAIGDDPERALSNYMRCLVFLNLVLVVMNYRVFRLYHENNVLYALNCLIFHFFSAIGWLILFFMLPSQVYFYIGWTLMSIINMYRIDIYIQIGIHISPRLLEKSFLKAPPPINVGLMAERFGLFIILAIGECIMGTVGAVVDFDVTTIIGLVLASLQGYMFKIAYFDMFDCTGEHAKVHATKRSKATGIACLYLHLPALMGVTLSSGLVVKVFNAHHTEDGVSIAFYQQLLYCCAFATTLMSFWKIHKQHLPQREDAQIMCVDENIAIHIVFLSMLCLSWIPISDPLLLQSVLLLLFLIGISIGAIMEWIESRSPDSSEEKKVADELESCHIAPIEKSHRSMADVESQLRSESKGYGSISSLNTAESHPIK